MKYELLIYPNQCCAINPNHSMCLLQIGSTFNTIVNNAEVNK